MAIAEMSKLNLIAMSYDKDVLLNALQATGATEIKLQKELENTVALRSDCENLREYIAKTEAALGWLSDAASEYAREHKIKTDEFKDGFSVTYSEFMAARDMGAEADALVEKINQISEEKRALSQEEAKLKRAMETAFAYSTLRLPFDAFAQTPSTFFALGTVSSTSIGPLVEELKTVELCDFKTAKSPSDDGVLLFVAVHKSAREEVSALLQNAGFAACPYSGGQTGEQTYLALVREKEVICGRIEENAEKIYALGKDIKMLKIYCDYLNFELEKAEADEKMRATDKTFLLEAYVPTEAEEKVKNALDNTTDAVYYEFSQPTEDEMPPTLYKNNAVVENFQSLTDMYSPPNYREFDPNTVMGFFYSLFLGFIIGDIGYGLTMLLGGGIIWYKLRGKKSGLKSFAGVFAVGGVFAIVWGILFNSFFGIAFPMPTIMPDAQGDMWTFIGVSMPAVLIICLGIGVIHLFVGYLCKAVQCWHKGHILDGIFDGLVWAIFSLGVGLAIIGLTEEANLPILATVGGIIAAVSLVIAMLTAGRKEKLLGKFAKGFSAAYGVINYVADVLSYSRLYGLMLSGSVIANLIAGYAVTGEMTGGVGFLFSGNTLLIILGVILLIIGNVFNLAVGLLGAFIHDAKLQFVEFYGKFYEGEGELFSPLGSEHKYICINN